MGPPALAHAQARQRPIPLGHALERSDVTLGEGESRAPSGDIVYLKTQVTRRAGRSTCAWSPPPASASFSTASRWPPSTSFESSPRARPGSRGRGHRRSPHPPRQGRGGGRLRTARLRGSPPERARRASPRAARPDAPRSAPKPAPTSAARSPRGSWPRSIPTRHCNSSAPARRRGCPPSARWGSRCGPSSGVNPRHARRRGRPRPHPGRPRHLDRSRSGERPGGVRRAQLLQELSRFELAARDLDVALASGELARAPGVQGPAAPGPRRGPALRPCPGPRAGARSRELPGPRSGDLRRRRGQRAGPEQRTRQGLAPPCPGGQQALAERRSRAEGPEPLVDYWRGRLSRSRATPRRRCSSRRRCSPPAIRRERWRPWSSGSRAGPRMARPCATGPSFRTSSATA